MVYVVMAVIIALLVSIDQVIKFLINANMQIGEYKEIIPNFFSLNYRLNTGCAFSILEDMTGLLIAITTAIIVVCVIYLFYLKKDAGKLERISLVLILSGGIGNLIDRIFRSGAVIDYINFDFFPAIFNFADCLVVVGVTLFIVSMILEFRKESKQHKKGSSR